MSRFGAVVSGGPSAGFHSPQLNGRDEVVGFLRAALDPGALVFNGYRSFRVEVSADAAAALLRAAADPAACAASP